MRKQLFKCLILAGLLLIFFATVGFAQVDNPLFTNIYTADPSPFVYNGRFYIVCGQDEAGSSEFDMYGWRLLSSADMETWTDHGIIARPADYSWMPRDRAWASCIVPDNGKFYFYTANSNQVGVLVADRIIGPYFDPNGKALIDANTTNHAASDIDPMCFIDDDGQAYLFWGGSGQCRYAKLNEDMISLKTNPITVSGLTKYLEAPFVIKANNTYFLMYADSPWPSNIRYATAGSINGPWTYRGVIGTPTGTGTNHEGAAYFNGRWWYTYHTEELSNGNPFSRCVCVEPLTINGSTIEPVSYSSFWLPGICRRLQSYNYPTRYIRHCDFDAQIDADVTPFQDSEWRIVPGLADSSAGYVSFEAVNFLGYYLKQTDYDLSLVKDDGTEAFKGAATFKQVPGLADGSGFSFQLYNDSSRYIRHYDYYLRLDPIDTALGRQDATFYITN